MKRKTLAFLFFGMAALAVAATGFLMTSPADAGGCSDCFGPTRTITGHGSGDDCSEALMEAESDAYLGAFHPGCFPCQTTNGPQSCAMPSCYPGSCPPNSFSATFTLNYKCQSCDIGPIDPLP